jgi:hypothetical protein
MAGFFAVVSSRVPSLLEPADLNLLDVYQHPGGWLKGALHFPY